MRFSYAESMTDPSFYIPLAQAAEAAGYDSMVIPDSICYPEHASSPYPYSPDGTREFLDGKPFLEPFSLIPALGAVTTRLQFVTFVLKLPVRNAVLVAKQATSTAVLTGNRLLLGVGTSPWREDYDILGVPSRRSSSLRFLRGRSRSCSAGTARCCCAGQLGMVTAGCTSAAIPPICQGCWPGSASCAGRKGRPAGRSGCT